MYQNYIRSRLFEVMKIVHALFLSETNEPLPIYLVTQLSQLSPPHSDFSQDQSSNYNGTKKDPQNMKYSFDVFWTVRIIWDTVLSTVQNPTNNPPRTSPSPRCLLQIHNRNEGNLKEISFQGLQLEPLTKRFASHPLVASPYVLLIITLCQNKLVSLGYLHNHLASKALFLSLKLATPKPPSSLLKTTKVQTLLFREGH